MNMPGFTAEQGLKQHQGSYLQRSTGQPVEGAGDVRPQFILRLICDGLSESCVIDGDLSSCRAFSHLCTMM